MTRIKQRFSIQASLQALVVIIILPLIQVQGSSNSGSSAPPPPPAYTNRDYDESNEYEYAAAAPAGAAASDYYTDVDPRQQQQQASAYAAGETDPSADWGENQPYNTEGEPPYTDPEAPYYQQQQQQQGPPLSQKTPVFPSPIDRVPPTRTGPRGPFDKAQAASPKAYTPIHYQFPATTTATTTTTATATDGLEDDDDDDYQNLSQETSEFASARQDVITRYMTTRRGRLQLYACAGMVGGSLGAFFAKSLFSSMTLSFFTTCFVGAVLASWLRNPYGELVRALGMSLVMVLERTTRIRRTYPTARYIPTFVTGRRNRPPFPPARNPWKYTPRRNGQNNEVEFNMMYSLASMAFIGSACGGNISLLPTWLGGLAGALLFAFGTTLNSSRGDLCRCMGMRVVALITELWDIQADLNMWPKIGLVASKVLDKLLILDRKHKIKDRIVQLVVWGYNQVQQASSQVQGEGKSQNPNDDNNDDDNRRRGGGSPPKGERRPERRNDDGENNDRRRGGTPPSRGERRPEGGSPRDDPRRRRDPPRRDDRDYDDRAMRGRGPPSPRNDGYADDDYYSSKKPPSSGTQPYEDDDRPKDEKPKKGRFWK